MIYKGISSKGVIKVSRETANKAYSNWKEVSIVLLRIIIWKYHIIHKAVTNCNLIQRKKIYKHNQQMRESRKLIYLECLLIGKT